jgi:hypothetical protein
MLKVGAEKSIALFNSNLTFCGRTNGAFTIDSSTPINFQNHRMIEISQVEVKKEIKARKWIGK